MTEFLKTKMHFALALLGTLFALHPFVEKIQDKCFYRLKENIGTFNLDVEVTVFHAYALTAGLLALTVYCYAMTLLSERPRSWVEKIGNYAYGLAISVVPLCGGLFLADLLAQRLENQNLAWAGLVAPGLGLSWLILSQLAALLLRKRLSDQDRTATVEKLAEQEIESLNRARELFATDHYDLAVIEAWKALEARLRRVLLMRGITKRFDKPQAMIAAASKAGLLSTTALKLVQELRHQWNVAVSTEPLTREAADKALSAARHILSTIPIEQAGGKSPPLV
jgi:HEPN domain-containing protein